MHSVVGCLRHEFGVERVQRAPGTGAQEQTDGAGRTTGGVEKCCTGTAAVQWGAAGVGEIETSTPGL